MFDKDAGRKTYVEEIYEQQDRNFPGGTWKEPRVPWTDVVRFAPPFIPFSLHISSLLISSLLISSLLISSLPLTGW